MCHFCLLEINAKETVSQYVTMALLVSRCMGFWIKIFSFNVESDF